MVRLGSTCVAVRPRSGSGLALRCGPVFGGPRFASVRLHVHGWFSSVWFQVWRGSVRAHSHQLCSRLGSVRCPIWLGSADSNSHDGDELNAIRFGVTLTTIIGFRIVKLASISTVMIGQQEDDYQIRVLVLLEASFSDSYVSRRWFRPQPGRNFVILIVSDPSFLVLDTQGLRALPPAHVRNFPKICFREPSFWHQGAHPGSHRKDAWGSGIRFLAIW